MSDDKGDADDFTAFVTARMERWRRGAFPLCCDWHLADDLVSVTVAQVYRHWRTVRRADIPDAFAQRILTRSWLTERRRPWRRGATVGRATRNGADFAGPRRAGADRRPDRSRPDAGRSGPEDRIAQDVPPLTISHLVAIAATVTGAVRA